jgi:hypothetical protein
VNLGNAALNAPSAVKTVTLYNYQLTTALKIASITAQPSNYAVAGGTCGATLAAKTNCTITLTATPTALGAIPAGTLTIATNAANSPLTVALSGMGQNPAAVSPAAVNFGSVTAGAASAAKNVTLYNYQQTPLSIASITAQPSNYAVSATTCGATLAASSTCVITLIVTPAALGAVPAGTLTVATNTTNSPLTVALSATGVNPTGVSPAVENFGSVAINTASAVKTVTLSNYLLTPLSIAATVQPSNYTIVGGTCGSWMGPQSHCTITLTATPTGLGAVPAGTLTIATNAVNSPLTVALSGSGVNPTTVSPTVVNFGNVAINTASAAKTVTLTNNQLMPLSIASITAQPSNYAVSATTCGSTLAAQSHCTITLTATPTALGAIPAGTLTIATNAANSPLTVTLSGKGIK